MAKTVTLRKVEGPAEQSNAALQMIERIIAMPDLPIDRVQEAWTFYQQVRADEARCSYDSAFAEMQPELPIIAKKGKSHQNKYALWEDIVEDVTPILSKHGFSISFRTDATEARVKVTAILAHKEGHREETSLDLPADTSGSKNAIQALGSTTSYGKRYTACALLNIVARGEDTDGNTSADLMDPISDDQRTTLEKLITSTKTDINKFLAVAGAESLSDVPKGAYDRLHKFLKLKQGARK